MTFGGTKAIAGGAKAIAVTSSGGAKAIAEPREQKSRRFLEAHPKDDARFHDPLAASPNRPFPSTSSEAEAAMRSKAIANKLNLELCAGSAGYSAKISKVGLSTLPVDSEHNRHKQKFLCVNTEHIVS